MPGASSSYNGFVAKLNKRFSGGLTLIASYQFSKAIDNASENQGWEINDRYRNANNLSLERSISGHDMPHSMAVAYIYELPVGKNRKLGSNMHPVADAVLGGWQVSGIVKMDSGLPLRFQAPQNDFSYSFWQYPNVTDVKAAGLEIAPSIAGLIPVLSACRQTIPLGMLHDSSPTSDTDEPTTGTCRWPRTSSSRSASADSSGLNSSMPSTGFSSEERTLTLLVLASGRSPALHRAQVRGTSSSG